MKILVRAKPKSKKVYIKKIDGTNFVAAIKEPPVDGRANEAIIKALADYFSITPSSIFLISGKTSKQKVFEIPLLEEELPKIGEPIRQLKMIE